MLPKISEDLRGRLNRSFMDAVIFKRACQHRKRAGTSGYDHSFNKIWLFERFCDASWSFWAHDQNEV